MKRIVLGCLFSLNIITAAKAQVDIATTAPVVIDFSNATPSSAGTSPQSAFTGAGFSPNPTTAGRLNSNAWMVGGMSDGSTTFGGTSTSGDFARASTSAAVTTGGLYAFTGSPASAANPTLWIQPTGDDFSPGTITLKLRNINAASISSLSISYNVYVRNDQANSSSFNFSYSTDGTTFTPVAALDYATPAASTGSTVVLGAARSTNLQTLSIPTNGDFFLRWTSDDVASGTRDEIGLDDISITAAFNSIPACVAPSNSPTTLTFPSTTASSINGSFSAASGGADGYVVFSAPSSTTAPPTLTNGTTYTNSNAPTGYTFVSSGTGTTFTASGLTQGTSYRFFVFAYNSAGCSGGPAYNTSALTGTVSTQSTPACTAPASASSVNVVPASTAATGTFTAPTPAADSFVIFYAFGTASPPTLSNGTSYNSSNTPGTYGLVGKQEGANTSFSIPGLTASTQYTVFVFSYNAIGCTGGPVYAASSSATFTTTAASANTYTWNVGSGLWSTPSSWTPARTAPAASDVLVFDGATQAAPVATVDFTSPEAISQLKFQNGVLATFLTASDRTLNIGQGAAGDDLSVQAGSKLTVQASANGAGLSLVLAAVNTGVIADSVRFAGNSFPTQDHRLTSNTAGALAFVAGGSLSLATNFSGNPFGGNTQNSVVFENGSSLIQSAGSNPFSLTAPASVVVFQPTSNYYYTPGGSTVPAVSGRTFGNFIVGNNTTVNLTNVANNVAVNNLIVDAGSSFALAGSNANTFTIGGDITANGPVTLNAGSGGTVFTSAAPVIGGTDRVTFADPITVANITLGNADSVVLSAAMNVTNTLTLTAGRIITGANTLTLGSSAAAPGALVYNGGVVVGTFKRWMAASTNAGTSGLFPMGRPGTGERRLATVEFTTAPSSGGSLTAILDSVSLNTVNATVTTDGTCPGGFTASTLAPQYLTITAADGLSGGVYSFTLQHQNPGQIANLCELAIAKRADENGTWAIDGVQDYAIGSVSEPVVRHTALTGFSDFAIAGSSANPLPIDLARFDAVAKGRTAHLSWSLSDAAKGRNVTIERSNDGRAFSRIALLQESGADGIFVDETPANGRNFYRLRIADFSGNTSVSAVRSVTFDGVVAGISVFPNPATDVLHLRGSGSISAMLYDATGRVVRTVADVGLNADISLGDVPAGLYLLHATDGTNSIQERVQVTR